MDKLSLRLIREIHLLKLKKAPKLRIQLLQQKLDKIRGTNERQTGDKRT